MARIRTVKPEFFSSERIALLSIPARLTFIGLLTEADDYGSLIDNHRLLKGHLWPHDDEINAIDVSLHVQQIVDAGLVRRYEIEGRKLLSIVGFAEHQRVNRPSERKLPPPPWEKDNPHRFCDDSRSTHGGLTEGSVSAHGGLTEGSPPERKGMERKGSSSARARTREAPRSPARQDDDDDERSIPDQRAAMALRLVAEQLAASNATADRAGYVRTVLGDTERLAQLEQLAAAHSDRDAEWLAREHRGHAHPTAACPHCGATNHPPERCLAR
jgi:hypothetical protein